MLREIVIIDDEKCDGCGLCVPSCHEGAIQIIDGKARLVDDSFCDGLGACLGHCPQDAIRIEQREAVEFDEPAAMAHVRDVEAARPQAAQAEPAGCPSARLSTFAAASASAPQAGGCPSARFAQLGERRHRADGDEHADVGPDSPARSELSHWPIQLRLLPPSAPVLRGARLLVCADCVPFAYADFHSHMLRGRVVVIACPKLDDTSGYIEKLAEMMRLHEPEDIMVARMEVPCCSGILMSVLEARRQAGAHTPVIDAVLSVQGELLQERTVPLGPIT
jgi:Pyruvate/2-oxoacid:ferredoxin oxidoreductase delta subunit